MRILVTYGWCRTSYVLLRSLAARGHEVFTCSHLQPAMALWSRHSKGGAIVRDPFTEPEAFTHDVARLCDRWGIEAIFPGHEDAIALRRYGSLLPDDVSLICPSLADLSAAVDKARMAQTAHEAGVPIPRTAFPNSSEEAIRNATEVGFPVVLKLRRSNGGKGVRLVRSESELRALLEGPFAEHATNPNSFAIVQEFVEGYVSGGCALANEGEVVGFFGERYLRTKDGGFGTSTYREWDGDPTIRAHTIRMLNKMRWTGLAHFDFIVERQTGRVVLLEMNPRPWGAIHLAVINGYDFPAAAAAQCGGPIERTEYFPVSPPAHPKRSLWPVGEGIRLVSSLTRRHGRGSGIVSSHPRRTAARTFLDGWDVRDPAPAVAEALCYLWGFVSSGGELNPSTEGMHAAPDSST